MFFLSSKIMVQFKMYAHAKTEFDFVSSVRHCLKYKHLKTVKKRLRIPYSKKGCLEV